MVAAEKLDAVSVHVSGISKLLRQYKQQQEQADNAAGVGDHAAGFFLDVVPDAVEVMQVDDTQQQPSAS